MAVIFRLPAFDPDRLVVAYAVGRQAALQRGEIDERLERRAGLALGGDRTVELALPVIAAADHGAHCAVRCHRNQRALADLELVAFLCQFLVERLFGVGLQACINGRRNRDVFVNMAEHVIERVHHPVGDVIDRAVAGLRHDARRLRQRHALVALADEVKPGHHFEHDLGSFLSRIEIAGGCQSRGRAHQAGQQSRFGEGYLLGGFAEIALRGLFNAVGAGPEIDTIQIELEDLRFRKIAFQPQREQQFLQLAVDRTFLSQKEIFRQLLRDGGAALGHAAMPNVGDQRARDAVRVDAVMLVEAPILDGDEGLRNVVRQFFQRQNGAAPIAAGGERMALIIHDPDRGRPLGNCQRLDRRQVGAGPGQRADGGDDEPQADHRAPIGHAADERAFAATRFALAPAFSWLWATARAVGGANA